MPVPYIPFVETIFERLEIIYLNRQFLLAIVFKGFLASIKVEFSPSKKICFISFNESPLEIMKNAFYFILKAI